MINDVQVLGASQRTISVPIRVRLGIEHYSQWSTRLRDDGETGHVEDGELTLNFQN